MEPLLTDEQLRQLVGLLVRAVELVGIAVIFVGAVTGFVRVVLTLVRRQSLEGFTRARLDLGRFLALGLEFQLASDLLRTAVAPSFEEIGKLAAVAAIRTGLNFFLERELSREGREVRRRDEERRSEAPSNPGGASNG